MAVRAATAASRRQHRLAQAFHEVKHDTPKVVKQTEKKFGAQRAAKQKVAIALSKARKK